MADELRERIEALRPWPEGERLVQSLLDLEATTDAALARFESPKHQGLDVERLVRSDRFRDAVRDVFMAPGEWGPAQGYYAEWIELFIDALAARLAEEPDDG